MVALPIGLGNAHRHRSQNRHQDMEAEFAGSPPIRVALVVALASVSPAISICMDTMSKLTSSRR